MHIGYYLWRKLALFVLLFFVFGVVLGIRSLILAFFFLMPALIALKLWQHMSYTAKHRTGREAWDDAHSPLKNKDGFSRKHSQRYPDVYHTRLGDDDAAEYIETIDGEHLEVIDAPASQRLRDDER